MNDYFTGSSTEKKFEKSFEVKVKVKFTVAQAMKAQMGSRCIVLLFL
jgi:hypothetical protein